HVPRTAQRHTDGKSNVITALPDLDRTSSRLLASGPVRRARMILALGLAAACSALAAPPASAVPPIRHVFLVILENKSYDETFGSDSPAPYLAETLPSKGQLLTHYYGIGHESL